LRIARVYTDRPRYGQLVDEDNLVLFDGDPFDLPTELPDGPTVRMSDCRILPPVEPGKIMGIGRNYRAHAEEMSLTLGPTPSVFLKPLETLIPHRGTVVLPSDDVSSHVEHEAEIAVVIGRRARNVPSADWADYVLGFTCANDVSARDLQKSDPQITRGKGFDTFCPLGPWVNTDFARDEPTEVVCLVNGVEKQRATTESLIFPIPTLIEWLSSWTTLNPGDVILTGSPGGTSKLEPGDSVEISVAGVGTLQHFVAATESGIAP
jgi:2-keto-4-pentenoate hydratase/2-oxohepta-3-ene-1,7-dioic acid hydratase in catechol pathway